MKFCVKGQDSGFQSVGAPILRLARLLGADDYPARSSACRPNQQTNDRRTGMRVFVPGPMCHQEHALNPAWQRRDANGQTPQVLRAQPSTFAWAVNIEDEQHTGNAAAKTAQKPLHGRVYLGDMIEEQHCWCSIGSAPQTRSREAPRDPSSRHCRKGALEGSGNVVQGLGERRDRACSVGNAPSDRGQEGRLTAADGSPQDKVFASREPVGEMLRDTAQTQRAREGERFRHRSTITDRGRLS
jgi:hypothetical protein